MINLERHIGCCMKDSNDGLDLHQFGEVGLQGIS